METIIPRYPPTFGIKTSIYISLNCNAWARFTQTVRVWPLGACAFAPQTGKAAQIVSAPRNIFCCELAFKGTNSAFYYKDIITSFISYLCSNNSESWAPYDQLRREKDKPWCPCCLYFRYQRPHIQANTQHPGLLDKLWTQTPWDKKA